MVQVRWSFGRLALLRPVVAVRVARLPAPRRSSDDSCQGIRQSLTHRTQRPGSHPGSARVNERAAMASEPPFPVRCRAIGLPPRRGLENDRTRHCSSLRDEPLKAQRYRGIQPALRRRATKLWGGLRRPPLRHGGIGLLSGLLREPRLPAQLLSPTPGGSFVANVEAN